LLSAAFLRLLDIHNDPAFDFLHADGRYRSIIPASELPLHIEIAESLPSEWLAVIKMAERACDASNGALFERREISAVDGGIGHVRPDDKHT
jgi:hypothetical protein